MTCSAFWSSQSYLARFSPSMIVQSQLEKKKTYTSSEVSKRERERQRLEDVVWALPLSVLWRSQAIFDDDDDDYSIKNILSSFSIPMKMSNKLIRTRFEHRPDEFSAWHERWSSIHRNCPIHQNHRNWYLRKREKKTTYTKKYPSSLSLKMIT